MQVFTLRRLGLEQTVKSPLQDREWPKFISWTTPGDFVLSSQLVQKDALLAVAAGGSLTARSGGGGGGGSGGAASSSRGAGPDGEGASASPLPTSQPFRVWDAAEWSADLSPDKRLDLQADAQRAFQRGGPHKYLAFAPRDVCAAIVTCGGLCPGAFILWSLYCWLASSDLAAPLPPTPPLTHTPRPVAQASTRWCGNS